MDEVALDPGRGLLDQEEYHIDFDAPGINTDELDLGLEDLVEEQSGDVADPEVEDSLPVLEEIGYDEELQGDDNPDDTNPDDLALKPLGEEEEEEEEADTREEEIEYDDEDLPVDTADAISGENPDTDLIGPHDGGVTLDLTIDEVEHADYDHNNGEGFGYIDLQTADPDTQADELNDSFPGAVSTTDDGKYGDDEPSRLQEGDDYDTPGDEQSRADDIDDGDFDIAKKDEVSSSSYLPDVTVQYNRVRYSLFGGPQDHAEDYFLKDVGVLDRPLSQLFSSLRSIIMDEISPTDELLIRIDKLDGLEFREHSSSPFLNRTFREILDVYYRLLSNDGLGEDRLHISLVVVPGSEDVFARFLTAAEEGQGLSELAVSSEEASAIEQDDELAGNEEEDRAEDEDREEDVVLTEFTEQYTDRDEAAASRNNNEIEARGDPAPLDFIPDGEDFLESYPAESIADDQGVDSAQFEAPEHDDSGPHNGNGHPPEDEEGPVQDDEATAVDHGNDGVDYGDAVEDTENLVANGKSPSQFPFPCKRKHSIAFGSSHSLSGKRHQPSPQDILEWCTVRGDYEEPCISEPNREEGSTGCPVDTTPESSLETRAATQPEVEDLIDYSDDEAYTSDRRPPSTQDAQESTVEWDAWILEDEELAFLLGLKPLAGAIRQAEETASSSSAAHDAVACKAQDEVLTDSSDEPPVTAKGDGIVAAQGQGPNQESSEVVGESANLPVGWLLVDSSTCLPLDMTVADAPQASRILGHLSAGGVIWEKTSKHSAQPDSLSLPIRLPNRSRLSLASCGVNYCRAPSRDRVARLHARTPSESSFAISSKSEANIPFCKDAFDYITNPDGELEGADDGNVTGDDGDGEYNIEIENIGDGSTLDHEITTAVEIGDSATKVTQEQAAYASANGGEPSVQTSATSTLNGEEIAYDETHESLDQAVASDPAPYGSNGLDSTLDEIDWDNADEGEAVESSAVSTTPHSASGKRLRQAEDGPESLADDGVDNKRRRI